MKNSSEVKCYFTKMYSLNIPCIVDCPYNSDLNLAYSLYITCLFIIVNIHFVQFGVKQAYPVFLS